MADVDNGRVPSPADGDNHDDAIDNCAAAYKTPAPKSMTEILQSDANDDSLNKYKQQLLGGAVSSNLVLFPEDSRVVIVTKLSIVTDDRDRPEIELDLTGDISQLKKKPLVIKEGTRYRVKFYFYVQRDIVTGLRYVHSISKGIINAKETHMCGSYAPKADLQSCQSPFDEAPSGMLARGNYTVKSKFVDDDKREYAKFEWSIEIKKDWN